MKNIENNIDDKVEKSIANELENLKSEINPKIAHKENLAEKKEKFSVKNALDSLKETVLSKINVSENIADKENVENDIDAVFKKGIEEFTDTNDTHKEKRFVRKIKKVNFDNVVVKKEKEKSFGRVLSSIIDWKDEKNQVAKVLLRMANWIMSTEK